LPSSVSIRGRNINCRIKKGLFSRHNWCPPFTGYFLYYPSRRHQPAALSAVIETLRLQN
jgi:hypothetical protein